MLAGQLWPYINIRPDQGRAETTVATDISIIGSFTQNWRSSTIAHAECQERNGFHVATVEPVNSNIIPMLNVY